jgi:hypothetical protein
MPTLDTRTSKINLSRRSFMMFVAGAAVASPARYAQAQSAPWQEFRRDDLGFRIEMPGRPSVVEDKGLPGENLLRSIDAEVEYENLSLKVSYAAFKSLSAEQMLKAARQGLSALGGKINENALTMNGFPAHEIIVEPGIGDGAYYRFVFIGNTMISFQAVGGGLDDPTARRFVDSFRLMAAAR